MRPNFHTPLRYPGGKSRFAPFIASVMKDNELFGGHYLEPYAGGAAVALSLLFNGTASHIHINDFDPAVYDFWISITHDTETFLRLLRDTPIDIEQWHYQQRIFRGEIKVEQTERGFATFFLNRTNRSGILKGGVIGGKEQTGKYKLDARFKKADLSTRIGRIAKNADHISVYNEDALSLLTRCADFLPESSLIYLDPPYYVKGKGLYRNFYAHEDHLSIATLLHNGFPRHWVVSYDNVNEIQQMYQASRLLSYDISYTAQKCYLGSEVMFFSQNLSIPVEDLPIPANAA